MISHVRSGRFSFLKKPMSVSDPSFWPRIELGATLLLLITSVVSYVFLTLQAGSIEMSPRGRLLVLLIVNAFLLLGLAALVGRRIFILIQNRRLGIAGSRLHLRMTAIFALLAVVPTILVAFYGALLFEFGFSFWFSDNVRSILTNAESVAKAYVYENRERIRDDVLAVRNSLAGDLQHAGDIQFQIALEREVTRRNLDEAVIFRRSADKKYLEFVAEVRFKSGILQERLRPQDVVMAEAGDLVVRSGEANEKDNIIQALVRFDQKTGYFIYVNRRASQEVLRQVASTRNALAQYHELNQQRQRTLIRFMGLLAILSVMVLLTAALAALYSADRLLGPIGHLIRAANRVGEGDLSVHVPEQVPSDDIATLSQTFNRMITQLQQHRDALISANAQLDGRRRFTEAVLSGVSAGVLGLSREGVITLPNQSAGFLLGCAEDDLLGQHISSAVPEMADLFMRCQNGAAGPIVELITITARPNEKKTLMVQITAEAHDAAIEPNARGYVMTFDDVTEALTNQRRAAWSDVARRIAHEIKNPLTPIQLSAERLRRKYLKEIVSDPEVFIACTDTIIRQVGDLRRMVDEFSSFARMPKPIFRKESLVDIVRQSLFLLQLAHPEIAFSFSTPPDIEDNLCCDRQQIGQAITNLIKNAIESVHTRMEKTAKAIDPFVRVTVHTQADGALAVLIADNGVGLPPDNRLHLFEPYVTTRERGTGLGLSIVKKIIEDHLGLLDLRDRAEGGAEALVILNPVALEQRMSELKPAE